MIASQLSEIWATADRCPDVKLVVVHNALIWPDNDWQLLIGAQLAHLRETGLAACASAHVVLSAPTTTEHFTFSQMEDMLADGRCCIAVMMRFW